jgi:hypothetical protein
MESINTAGFVLAAAGTVGLAALLGYLGQKAIGATMLAVGAALASVLCIAGALIGYRLSEGAGAWLGLVMGMALSGVLGARFLGKLIRGQSGRFIAGLWFGYCVMCLFGYLAGGWLGLLTITLPCVVIFWIGLYRISAYILPLRDRSEQPQAFRSLLTFSMGTNYPYYFAENGRAKEQVGGNPYNLFFAGPGLIYTDSHHAAYVTDGIRVKGVFDPGLNFTGMFDLPPKIIDLRTQVRPFQVQALSKDGIPVRLLAALAFRIHRGTQKLELGKPFPFRRRAVHDVVAREPIERKRNKEESGEKQEWDDQLIPAIGTRIVQDVLSRYDIDELCAASEDGRDPRVEIATEISRQMSRALQPVGLELVDGGIGDLVPGDEKVIRRRLDNWKTQWEDRILRLMIDGRVERARQIEQARMEAEKEIIVKFGQVIERSMADDQASETALALRFIDSLGEIVSRSGTQWPLPASIDETLNSLRGEVAEKRR